MMQKLEEAKAEMLIMASKMEQGNSSWFSSFIVVIVVGLLFAFMFTKSVS